MKDTIIIRRLKRIGIVFFGNLKHLLWKALPYLVAAYVGSVIGTIEAHDRIHNDCKFTNSFRIATTGYTCEIGK